MTETPIKLSVIVVTHNSELVLEPFAHSLRNALESIPARLIVVDNASSDNSITLVKQLCPEALVIENRSNLGFAAAANQGAIEAMGEWLLFLNPDLVLDRDAPAELLAEAKNWDRAGLVTGRVRSPEGKFQSSCRQLPTYSNLVFSRQSWLGRWLGGGDQYTMRDFREVTEVPAVSGTMLLIRKKVFESLGRFDPAYFMYVEDTDLSRRSAEAGYLNLYVPSAGAIHHWGESSTSGRLVRGWYHHQSLWRYFLKYHKSPISMLLLPFFLAVNFLLLMILPGRRRN